MGNNEKQDSMAKGIVPPSIQPSLELQQQVSILNARINNANLAYSDLLREIDSTFKVMVATIAVLQRENAELKVKLDKA